jgi:hypothetical protein
MPYDDPDPSDPSILIGVEAPANPGGDEDMAYVFAEEYARMGFAPAGLLELFHNPFYAGAYRALEVLGEAKIRAIIGETFGIWGRVNNPIVDAEQAEAWDISLDSLREGG